ncbi:Pycsar system effector family protein [Actinoplanes siamensis]|uniref:Pycsar effector protein domain-containing protein n=1 Tax=Actinoplanes siamensis TaxID=1223317 RepID=A0A919KBA9_9ACTN|nr:Pycsar system effector family protein [Actinoplanes siamensis]GIF03410.1 hypothetical protein Asi03nite_09480 [Actinoplanes siamensis]
MTTRKSPPAPAPAGVEDAWRALTLQFDQVKHAETKAAATLASSGVLGGLLYTLVSQHRAGGALFAVAAIATAAAVVTAAGAAGVALRPRTFLRDGHQNLLFYRTIAGRFGHDAEAFHRELSGLLGDRAALLSALSGQILTNANVAARKYHAVTIAVLTLLVGLGLLAVTATIGVLAR